MVTASDWKARWGEGGSEEISARGGEAIRSPSVPCRAVPSGWWLQLAGQGGWWWWWWKGGIGERGGDSGDVAVQSDGSLARLLLLRLAPHPIDDWGRKGEAFFFLSPSRGRALGGDWGREERDYVSIIC
jgi:hypothetical protein